MFKIRNKILLIFLSVVIIPIIIISTFFGLRTTKSLKQNKISELQQSAENKVEKANLFIRSVESDIRSLTSNILLLSFTDASAREDSEGIKRWKFDLELFLKAFSENRRIYDQIRFIDETGLETIRVELLNRFYADIAPAEELQDKSHRYYFKEAIKLSQGEVYVSRLDLNKEDREIETPHKPMLRYALPVFDVEMEKKGVFVLNVLADYLLKNILTHSYHKGVDSYLLDKDGFFLLHPEISKRWGGLSDLNTGENIRNDFTHETVSHILSGETGYVSSDKHIINFIPIRFDPSDDKRYWIFMESIKKSIAYAPIYAFYKIFGLLVFLIITGVVTAAFLFSKKLTKPLNELVEGATTIMQGDLDYRITVKSNDEFSLLTSSFNNMTSQLGESKRQLQNYAHNLERKVIVKTREIVQSEEKYRELFETVTDGIVFISFDGNIIDCNKGFLDMTGYSVEEIRTKNYWNSITTEMCGGKDKIVKELIMERGYSDLYETNYIKKDFAVFPVSVRIWLKKEDDGTVKGMWAIARDITEHKRAEENMCKLSNAIEQAGEAVAITNRKGVIEYVNPAFEKITGYSTLEAIGQNPRVLKSGKHPDKFYKDMWKTIIDGKIWKGDLINKKKDGSFYDEEMAIAPVKDSTGSITHFVAIKRDVTLQNEAKRQLIGKTKELEAVNRDLEDFLYITSHDLKEPLFVIDGYTTKLSRYYKDNLDDKVKRYINRIKSNSEIISQKINDVIEVLRVGKIMYNFENNDSNAIVESIIEMLDSKIKANETYVQVQDDLPVVLCDKERLKDVFLNLISNSIKFAHNDNHNKIKIGCNNNGSYYKFFVEDTGIGIRKEYQEQIFKMFRRLNDVEAEGNGVGLSIVKKIVEHHNGNVWVESPINNGRGSRFCFTIPIMKTT